MWDNGYFFSHNLVDKKQGNEVILEASPIKFYFYIAFP